MTLSSWSPSDGLSSWKEALRLAVGESFGGERRVVVTGEGEGEERGEDLGWTRWGNVLKWLFCGRKARGERSISVSPVG